MTNPNTAPSAASPDANSRLSKEGHWLLINPRGEVTARDESNVLTWARYCGYKPTVEALRGLEEAGWRVIPESLHKAGEAVAPEARADVLKQLRTAMDVVSALCDGSMRWTMSVPARPDSDPDLVISGALHAAEKLIAAAPPAPPAPLPYPQNLTPAQADARQKLIGLGGGRVGLDDDYEPPAPLPGKESRHMDDSELYCPQCNGSGEGRERTTGHGPDDYEYDCPCQLCGGNGSLFRAFEGMKAERDALRQKYNAALARFPVPSLLPADVEQRTYKDGTQATGIAPLPNKSPAEQERAALSAQAAPEYRTGFDEAPSTFNQEDAAPADYPPQSEIEAIAERLGATDPDDSLWRDFAHAAIDADRAQRSGVSADPLPRPLLTDLEIQGLRRQARNDPRCADQHWFILMVRAIESYYGVTGAAAQSQPLVEPTADRIIEVFYQDGEDPLICAVQGNFTVEVLAEIERDLKANDGDYFAKGDGTYRFECSHFPGQYGFEGRCEIAPGWELDELSFAVFPEQHQVKKGEPS